MKALVITPGTRPTPRRSCFRGFFRIISRTDSAFSICKLICATTMGFYSTHIFPRLLDWSLANVVVENQRKEALAPSSSRNWVRHRPEHSGLSADGYKTNGD